MLSPTFCDPCEANLKELKGERASLGRVERPTSREPCHHLRRHPRAILRHYGAFQDGRRAPRHQLHFYGSRHFFFLSIRLVLHFSLPPGLLSLDGGCIGGFRGSRLLQFRDIDIAFTSESSVRYFETLIDRSPLIF